MIFKEGVSRRVLHCKDGGERKSDFENHYQKSLRGLFFWVEAFLPPASSRKGLLPTWRNQ
jgi:hypothetical protein